MNFDSVGISALSLSVIPTIAQSSGIKWTKRSLGSFLLSDSGSTGDGAHERGGGHKASARTSSCSDVQSSRAASSRDSSSAAGCFIPRGGRH